jgi:hypothetical protein
MCPDIAGGERRRLQSSPRGFPQPGVIVRGRTPRSSTGDRLSALCGLIWAVRPAPGGGTWMLRLRPDNARWIASRPAS